MTGLGSRMAEVRSPFASAGVAGATTLSPGVWTNQASGFCEWNGPDVMPPSLGARMTQGTAAPQR
jgi:hypothetical protein